MGKIYTHKAVPTNWGSFVVSALTKMSLLFGVYIGAPEFWKLSHGCTDPASVLPAFMMRFHAKRREATKVEHLMNRTLVGAIMESSHGIRCSS